MYTKIGMAVNMCALLNYVNRKLILFSYIICRQNLDNEIFPYKELVKTARI
jgi:hypothetical protein